MVRDKVLEKFLIEMPKREKVNGYYIQKENQGRK